MSAVWVSFNPMTGNLLSHLFQFLLDFSCLLPIKGGYLSFGKDGDPIIISASTKNLNDLCDELSLILLLRFRFVIISAARHMKDFTHR